MLIWLSSALAASALQPAPARDHSDLPKPPACEFAGGAVQVDRLSDLPPHVRIAVDRLFAPMNGMAEAGRPYNWTDVIASSDLSPRTRFVRAYFTGNIWFIWYDAGGVGIMRQTIGIGEFRDPQTGRLTAGGLPGSRFSGDLCAGSKAYLAGVRSIG